LDYCIEDPKEAARMVSTELRGLIDKQLALHEVKRPLRPFERKVAAPIISDPLEDFDKQEQAEAAVKEVRKKQDDYNRKVDDASFKNGKSKPKGHQALGAHHLHRCTCGKSNNCIKLLGAAY
jgi:hypothetical protein